MSTLLGQHSYINLRTYRKNGKEVQTPVWFVEKNGCIYVWTDGESGKAKRIRANGKASLAPSDARGNPLGDFLPARGEQLKDAEETKAIIRLFRSKYGIAFRGFEVFSRLRGASASRQVILKLTPNK